MGRSTHGAGISGGGVSAPSRSFLCARAARACGDVQSFRAHERRKLRQLHCIIRAAGAAASAGSSCQSPQATCANSCPQTLWLNASS